MHLIILRVNKVPHKLASIFSCYIFSKILVNCNNWLDLRNCVHTYTCLDFEKSLGTSTHLVFHFWKPLEGYLHISGRMNVYCRKISKSEYFPNTKISVNRCNCRGTPKKRKLGKNESQRKTTQKQRKETLLMENWGRSVILHQRYFLAHVSVKWLAAMETPDAFIQSILVSV